MRKQISTVDIFIIFARETIKKHKVKAVDIKKKIDTLYIN